MTLRADELSAVCAELEPILVGSPVHKLVQTDEHTLLVQLRGRWLLLCCAPRAGRIHLIDERPPGTGEAATSFCMLLRKHLGGARLASLRAVEGERACELEFATAADTPRLRLFLFGPSAQLAFVARGDDDRDARVLGSIGPARRIYDALPAPHPGAAANQTSRFSATSAGDAPISRAIDAAYSTLEHSVTVEDARRAALSRLDARGKKQRRLADALRSDLARADGAESRKKEGDLLLAYLHQVPRGARMVRLPDDFTDGSLLEIALDPARSAKDNAERLYKEHRRLHRARGKIEARLQEIEAQISALELERSALLDRGDDAILADARLVPSAPTAKARAAERALPYRRFASEHGVPIYVGRGANKNDELTWKVARGNDLWLHTRDVPGAHVIIPLEGGRTADPDTLVDAATLAAYHSSVRDEAQVDVGYALRKHLRKPKKAPAGAVLVSNQKTIRVRMEPARIARLLKSRVDD